MNHSTHLTRVVASGVAILSMCLLLTTVLLPPPASEATASIKLSKKDRIDLAMAQEFEMTQDPALGAIPRERLVAAYEFAEQKRQARTSITRGAISGIEWEERGPDNVGGRTRTILIDANDPTHRTVWAAGVAGGLWKSNDITAPNPAWQAIDDFFENLAITAIAQDPSNPDVMYFGTGEGWFNGDAVRGLGMWKSVDGGTTWNRMMSTSGSDFHYVQKIVVNTQGDVFACTRGAGLRRSRDGGATWQTILSVNINGGTSIRAADIEIAANGDLWASLGINQSGRLFHSTDQGDTWTRMTPPTGFPQSNIERIEIACAPSDANRVYAVVAGTDNSCQGIYRTENGGTSWIVCDNPPAFGMSNFCRNQAWYDLIAGVDPNNPDRLFIGGIDLLASTDAGDSFTQVSQWYGGNGLQYVHADQHYIVFEPGNSNVVYFGNDGGVWRSTNATATIPTIIDRNFGYNVTQYYACATSPVAGSADFLAGSQDNGTQRYTNAGVNSTIEVTGGDGAFCHIDQDNPMIQISSYVYNNYWITASSWAGDISLNIGNTGRFINPTDYDSETNILYACTDGSNFLRVKNIGQFSMFEEEISVPLLNGALSAVAVSPHTENRVFMAAGGRVVRVDNAHETPTATLISGSASMGGYASCIAISPKSDDHLIVTFSNYGVSSVWETRDGGDIWRNIEGDLPDMPVRWALFHPRFPDQVLLATELGVWSTDDLTAETIEWEPSNQGLANVRTDMLKLRTEDETVIAATHGRGVFSSPSLYRPAPSFLIDEVMLAEANADPDACNGYRDLILPVSIDRVPRTDLMVSVELVTDGSTADHSDYTWAGDSILTFPAGNLATQRITLRIWDDGIAEGRETLRLRLQEVVPETIYPGQFPEITFTIDDRDDAPQLSGVTRTRTLVEAGFDSELLPAGWTMSSTSNGSDEFQFGDVSAINRSEYTIPPLNGGAAVTSDAACQCDKAEDRLILPRMDLSDATAATLSFQAYFPQNGSGETARLLFSGDGGENWGQAPIPGFTSWNQYDISLPTLVGKSDVRVAFVYSDGGGQGHGLAIDEVSFVVTETVQIEVATELTSDQHQLGPNATIDFFSPEGEAIATLTNLSAHDFGCVSVEIDRAGIGTSDFWSAVDDRWDVADKTLFIEAEFPSSTAEYELTLYYTAEEITAWETATGYNWEEEGQMLRTKQAILQTTPSTPYPDGEDPIQAQPTHAALANSDIGTVTATFQGTMGGFGIGNPGAFAIEVADLLTFDAEADGEITQIDWSIVETRAVSRYEIERATLLDEALATWEQVAQTGDGVYDLVDPNPEWGLNQYRLKVVYLDGSTTYSQIDSVYFTPRAQLLTFEAMPVGNDRVQLDWSVADTDGVLRYDLYRAKAEEDLQAWEEVDHSGESTYELLDLSPAFGLNRYQLHLVYLDGSEQVSEVKEVYFYGDVADWQVFPNPFSEEVSLAFPAGVNEPAGLTLIDPAGRRVWTDRLDPGTNRVQRLSLPTAVMSPGRYVLYIQVDGQEPQRVKLEYVGR